jgi:uncharacterized protein (DUF1330 family)
MMLARIDPGAVARLARSQLPRPLDVLNLINLRDERSYARYGAAVAPAMLAVGARLRWMGHHERALHGTCQAERLLVVRYPSHRHFLAMTLNPYYLTINRLRERGVGAFAASFTQPEAEPGVLRSQRRLLVVHYDAPVTLEQLRAAIEPAVGPLIYASRAVASLAFLRDTRPTDPNPLSHGAVAFFAADENAELDGARLGPGVSAQLYRRTSPRALLAAAR